MLKLLSQYIRYDLAISIGEVKIFILICLIVWRLSVRPWSIYTMSDLDLFIHTWYQCHTLKFVMKSRGSSFKFTIFKGYFFSISMNFQIKYYKVIHKNCKSCWGAPTMIGCGLPKFWNVNSPKSSKTTYFWINVNLLT